MSEESDVTTSSSSESEDEEPTGDFLEKDFFKTLSHLKNKDPVIYDENVNFFTEIDQTNEPSTSQKSEHLFLRDYQREVLLGRLDENKSDLTYAEEQKNLKNKFKSLIENESDDEDLLQKKVKTDKEKIEEDEDYISWLKGRKEEISDKDEGVLKPLRDYWNNPNLDKGEEFLKDYILNQKWKEKEDEIQDTDLSEDEELLEAQDNFEREYNFQSEEGNKELKRFPRTVEGSLRKKDDSRKRKRAEINERKSEEKKKKKMDIQKAQKEKLNEIKTRLEQLKEATGNDALGFDDSDIIGDFDPEQHDQMMEKLYGEDYYAEEADFEKPEFEDDLDTNEVTRSKKKKERKRKHKKPKLTDLTDIIKPDDENFNSAADEFYSLDCEDFIDDIPCRFKYKEVVANDYGLTVEEILAADDADLNKWVPTSKLYKIRPPHVEKNEVKTYRQKGMDLKLKEKLLPSLFKKEEPEDDKGEPESSEKKTPTCDVKTEDTQEEVKSEDVKPKSNSKSKKKNKPQPCQVKTESNGTPISRRQKKNKKKALANKANQSAPVVNQNVNIKKKKIEGKFKKNSGNTISDDRLLAYDIKPKKFRSKMQFGT